MYFYEFRVRTSLIGDVTKNLSENFECAPLMWFCLFPFVLPSENKKIIIDVNDLTPSMIDKLGSKFV